MQILLQEGVMESVKDNFTATVQMLDSKDKLRIDQSHRVLTVASDLVPQSNLVPPYEFHSKTKPNSFLAASALLGNPHNEVDEFSSKL